MDLIDKIRNALGGSSIPEARADRYDKDGKLVLDDDAKTVTAMRNEGDPEPKSRLDIIREAFGGEKPRDMSAGGGNVAVGPPPGDEQPKQTWGSPVQPETSVPAEASKKPWWEDPVREGPVPAKPSGGGGPGMSAQDEARMMAGGRAISPQMIDAANEEGDVARRGADFAGGRSDQMQAAANDALRVRERMMLAQQERAAELRRAYNERVNDEAAMRRELRERADPDPQAYFKNHPAGPVAGHIMAGIGGFLSGLAGPGYAKDYADRLDKKIAAATEAQAAGFQNRMAMSKEQRAQWNDRVSMLGDIGQAKLSAHMQDLEAARDYFGQQADMAKNDQTRTRMEMAAAAVNEKLALRQQEFEQNVAKNTVGVARRRAAEGAAAANAARADAMLKHKEDREDRHRAEDAQFRASGAGRAGGAGGAGGSARPLTQGQLATHLEKYSKDVRGTKDFGLDIGRMEEQLNSQPEDLPGFGPLGQHRPTWSMDDDAKRLRQTATSLMNSEVYRQSGKAITKEEYERLTKAMNGYGDKKDLEWGLSKLREMHQYAVDQHENGTLDEVRDTYSKNEAKRKASGGK